jgi:hypothetical protein
MCCTMWARLAYSLFDLFLLFLTFEIVFTSLFSCISCYIWVIFNTIFLYLHQIYMNLAVVFNTLYHILHITFNFMNYAHILILHEWIQLIFLGAFCSNNYVIFMWTCVNKIFFCCLLVSFHDCVFHNLQIKWNHRCDTHMHITPKQNNKKCGFTM